MPTPLVSPLRVHELVHGDADRMPDIIEFAVSPYFLNRPNLYPRQATILKTIFLRTDLFCADEQTDILTKRGWRSYWEVIEGEDVLTVQPDTGLAEWAPAEKINVFPVTDEPLVLMEGYGHSSLTTPNHRWLVERSYQQRQGGTERRRQFVETKDLIGTRDRIACAAPVVNLPVEAKWSDALVELVAWYWTEGHLLRGGGVRITQSHEVNPSYVDRIRGCFTSTFGPPSASLLGGNAIGWREYQEGSMTVFHLGSRAADVVTSAAPGTEKVLASGFLGELTQAQLGLLIQTSVDADGTEWAMPSGKTKREISQKSKARLDAFQMACSMAGVRTVLSMRPIRGEGKSAGREHWHLSLYDSRTHFTPQTKGRNFSIREVRYSGHVWCPTTKNGTWLARRDGKVYFTGNTQYDLDVLGEWETTFQRTGNEGCSPKIMERIAINQAAGRSWFREVDAVIGRRGGKGYIGAIAGAYVLWNYMHRPGGPQEYYGIDRDKRLTAIVFAGKKEQAVANQWRDLSTIILNGPCFAPYISRPQSERLTVYAPNDVLRMQQQQLSGIRTDADQATFEIIPMPSTLQAGRGPASFMQHFDEMAHILATGANRSAEDVYAASTPSLDQFKKDAFIYAPSSPWQMQGQFYENWKKAIALNELGEPEYPEMVMFQLPSWGPYEDWDEVEHIPLTPTRVTRKPQYVEVRSRSADGKVIGMKREWREVEEVHPGLSFQPLKLAVQAYDDDMKQLEKANPETFAVERRSHWSESMASYLSRDAIEAAFGDYTHRIPPYLGEKLTTKLRGPLSITYKAHGDPSVSNAGFGWAIAHAEPGDASSRGIPHVVFDVVHSWRPTDYSDHTIDYLQVEEDIEGYIERFTPDEVTFDQYNSASVIGRLRRFVQVRQFPKRISIFEKTSTAPHNWRRAETFKTALNMGLIHIPMLNPDGSVNEHSELAELELRFLEEKKGRVDHPTSGPVQTKDIADALMECVYTLIGDEMGSFLGKSLGEIGIVGSSSAMDPYRGMDPTSRPPQSDAVAALSALSRGGGSPGGMARGTHPGRGSGGRGMTRR